jgi:class 3 adenylate cyclase
MGIHSGPVSGITDVNDRSNVAGAGINLAQRVMDCGDAGHILLSKHVAEDLEEYVTDRWLGIDFVVRSQPYCKGLA